MYNTCKRGESIGHKFLFFVFCLAAENDSALSPDRTDGQQNEPDGSSKIESLKKQIAVEMKVKQGAENMLAMYNAAGSKKKDSKLIAEAQQMLEDSKTKIEIIRMALLREQQQGVSSGREDGVLSGSASGKENAAPGLGLSPLELRIEDVRHHIEIESRVIQGAKNMIKFLQKSGHDKKGLVEVSVKHSLRTSNWQATFNHVIKVTLTVWNLLAIIIMWLDEFMACI